MNAATAFKKFFTNNVLVRTYMLEIRPNPSIGIDHITCEHFEKSLDSEINIISRKVENGTYRFTPYRELLLSKGAGKNPRVVSIPTVRDKLVIKTLSKVLDCAFAANTNAPTPQKLILEIINGITTERYDTFIKIDISHFYKSINQSILLHKLKSRIRKQEILTIINNAISTSTTPMDTKAPVGNSTGVPEGLAISNKLANIYLLQFDKTIEKKNPDIAYYRYVDDILVLCQHDRANEVYKLIDTQLSKLDLCISQSKEAQGDLKKGEFGYLGYRFTPKCITVQESAKRRIEHSIESIIRKIAFTKRLATSEQYRQKKKLLFELKVRITGCKVVDNGVTVKRFGWLFYYSKIDDIAYLAQLDRLVIKLANRFSVLLPDDTPKFKKAYYQMRYYGDRSTYFVTYNYLEDIEQKKRQLSEYYDENELNGLTEDELNNLFFKYVRVITNKLEQDVGSVS